MSAATSSRSTRRLPGAAIAASLFLLATAAAPARALTTSWINPAGGSWGTASNWSNGVPGPADDALITLSGNYTVTLNVNASVGSLTLGGASGLQQLRTTGPTLTLNGPSSFGVNALARFESSAILGVGPLTNRATNRMIVLGSSISVPVHNEGVIQNFGIVSYSGAFTTTSTSTFQVLVTNGTAVNLTFANGFTNHGYMELNNYTSIPGSATLNVTSGALINEVGASIGIGATSSGGARTLNASLDNRGVISAITPLSITGAGADHVNSGTIAATGANITITQSGTTPSLTNTGLLRADAGRILQINGGELIVNGGSGIGAGTLRLSGVTATLNADFSATSGSYISTTFGGPGRLLNAGTAHFEGATVNNPEFVAQSGTTTTFGNTTTNVNGAMTSNPGALLRFVASSGGSTTNFANGFTNNGTMQLFIAGSAAGAAVTVNVTNGTLVNPAGSLIDAQAGGFGGAYRLNAEVQNAGTIRSSNGWDLVFNRASSDHVNTGAIEATGGNIFFQGSGTTPTFTTSGAITVGTSRHLGISGSTGSSGATIGIVFNGGTFSGDGIFRMHEATVTLNTDLSPGTVNTAFGWSGFTGCVVGGTGKIVNTTSMGFQSSVINVEFDNQAYCRMSGGTNVFNGAVSSIGSINVIGDVYNDATCVVTNGFTNRGVIELWDVQMSRSATFRVVNGTLVNAPGARIQSRAGQVGGLLTLEAQIDNQGRIETLSEPLRINKSSADHFNRGTILVSGGDLTISHSGTTPTFMNCGTIDVSAGRTLNSTSGQFINGATGVLTGAGTYNFGTTFRTAGTITASAGTGGAISPSGAVAAACGTDQVFTITPAPCYRIADVRVDGVSVGPVSSYTFTYGDPTANHTISATFALETYTITASAGPGGSISPAGETAVACGSDQAYVIAADACYSIADVLVDGVSVGAVSSWTFEDVAANHTISATFALNSHTITASAGAGGSISPAGETAVACGSDQAYVIAAGACYSIADVLVDGVSVGAVSSYSFENVAANHTISATFALNSHTITASAGAGGSISPAGETAVACGSDQAYVIAAGACYSIADVLVDGVSVGAVSSWTFEDVAANHTISATFALNSYTITASAGAGGSISPNGAVVAGCGSDQSFTIAADVGYAIADVLVDGSSVGAVAIYAFEDVATNHTIAASFAPVGNLTAAITSPYSGAIFPVNTAVTFTGSFAGDAPGTTHTAGWTVDGTPVAGVVNESTGGVTGSHVFTTPGVYFLTLTVSSSTGASVTVNEVGGLTAMVVIYDANGGHVTGGGWIQSPAGAYVASPSATGKANFGFVSKYKTGATVPTGQTEFQFKTGNLNFHSSLYEWLVVAGNQAMYKGTGKINGGGDYGFLLSAIDGDVGAPQGPDRFRIKIWDRGNGDAVVYDNQLGAADTASATTVIGGGSIVIHRVQGGGRTEFPAQSELESAPRAFAMRNAGANPFRAEARTQFDLPEAAQVRMAVYDLLGRHVADLAGAGFAAGRHEVSWNGRDAGGRSVDPGIYFVRLEARFASGRVATATHRAVRMH